MNRAEAKEIRAEIEKAMMAVAKKFKMNLDLGNGTFTDNDFAVRVKIVETGAPAKKATTRTTKTSMSQSGMATMLGLPADIIGKKFKHKTKTMTVTGLTPSRPKNCVSLVDQNGRPFKCSASALLNMMKK